MRYVDLRAIGLLAAAAILLVGCSTSGPASGSPAPEGATVVTAVLKEFSITLGDGTAPTGPVDIAITNSGGQEHEFVVFQTDLAADQLPLSADGLEIDEEGAGLTAVDEIEDIRAGATPHLTVDLKPGKYVFVCNLPAHYTAGMHAAFEVIGY